MANAVIYDPDAVVSNRVTRVLRGVSTARVNAVDNAIVYVQPPSNTDIGKYWDGLLPQPRQFSDGRITITGGLVEIEGNLDPWPDWAAADTVLTWGDFTDPQNPVTLGSEPVNKRLSDSQLTMFRRSFNAPLSDYRLEQSAGDLSTWKVQLGRPNQVVRFSAAEMEAAQGADLAALRQTQFEEIEAKGRELAEGGLPQNAHLARADPLALLDYNRQHQGRLSSPPERTPPEFYVDESGWYHTLADTNVAQDFWLDSQRHTDAIIGTNGILRYELDAEDLDDADAIEQIMDRNESRTPQNVEQLYTQWGGKDYLATLIANREARVARGGGRRGRRG